MQTNVCLSVEQFSGGQAELRQNTGDCSKKEAVKESPFFAMLKSETKAREEAAVEKADPPRAQDERHAEAGEKEAEREITKAESKETQKEQDVKKASPSKKEKAPLKHEKENALKKEELPRDPLLAAAVNAKAASKKEAQNEKPLDKGRAVQSLRLKGGEKAGEKETGLPEKVSGHKDEINLKDDFFGGVKIAAQNEEKAFGAAGFKAGTEELSAAEDGESVISLLKAFGAETASAEDALKKAGLDKNEKGAKITVRDLRIKTAGQEKNAAAETGELKAGVKDIKKDFVTSVRQASDGSLEMTLDLNQGAEKNILSLDGQSAAADGSTFQAMLKNQVTQNAQDFVKAGNIVLRDNNQGQINLILHPESLGNVKISLDMNGKVVQGHILVASREAMNAFNESAAALKEAFIQSGFEGAEFDVSYSQSQMNFAQNQGGNDDGRNASQHGRKIYGDFVSETINSGFEISDNFNSAGEYEVNIVA